MKQKQTTDDATLAHASQAAGLDVEAVRASVESVLAEPLYWFPVRHHSPAVARHLDAVLRAQQERDRRDAARDLAPMVPADDAVILDSTHLDLSQVVDLMESEVRRCLNRLNRSTDSGTGGGRAS